jgi:rubrerythrin
MSCKLWRCPFCSVTQARKSGAPAVCPVCKKKGEFEEVVLEAKLTVG